MSKAPQLVSQHLENISRSALEKYQQIVRRFVQGRPGVYALYRRKKLYYVGLAGELRWRLNQHLKDRHGKSWDKFSVYLTIAHTTTGRVTAFSEYLPDSFRARAAYNPRMPVIKVWTKPESGQQPPSDLQVAVQAAIGNRSGLWDVFFLDIDPSGDFKIIIDGPKGFHWSRKFLGPHEHAPDFVRVQIAKSMPPYVM